MSLRIGDRAPDFSAETTTGPIQFPRLARRFLVRAFLASEGLHAGVHDRARLSRPARAGFPAPQLQGDRAVGRPGDRSPALAWRHQGRDRRRRRLSADRRPRSRGGEALRHAAGGRRRELGGSHGREQPDGANGVSDRARQAHQGDAGLSDELGAEFRRGAAAARFLPAHGRSSRWRHPSTGSRARTSSSSRRCRTRRRGSAFRAVGRP